MTSQKRIIGIDAAKAFACLLVILLHTSSGVFFRNGNIVNDTLPSQILYYLGTGAVPLFFMANGFFLINRRTINYNYISHKIVSILIPVFLWNALIFLAYTLVGRHVNYFNILTGSLIQKGFFFQFWFLGALIIILLLVPLFNILLKKSPIQYFIFLIFLAFISFSIDLVNHTGGISTPIQMYVIQTFRLWTWLFYYLLGGVIGHVYESNRTLFSPKTMSLPIIVLTISSITYSVFNMKWINTFYAEYNYDNIIIAFWIISLFIFLISIDISSKTFVKIIELVSSSSMGIYIIHVPILKIVKHLMNATTLGTNIVEIIIVFTFSLFCTYILFKIPFTRLLVHL